ncbi:helix-turn-helix domain-containing protein [Caldifermentibacillus hisashii]|uniref:helix-turn-helix domain-containing protein n=1 Tax=Caldifermentibacillus hisashii TaxID=996558 RepID=UPI0034D42FA3
MDLQKEFGKLLRKARENKGLTQEELALSCELDRTYISLLERGKRSPTLKKIFDLCEKLEVTPSDLIRELEEIVNKKGT